MHLNTSLEDLGEPHLIMYLTPGFTRKDRSLPFGAMGPRRISGQGVQGLEQLWVSDCLDEASSGRWQCAALPICHQLVTG